MDWATSLENMDLQHFGVEVSMLKLAATPDLRSGGPLGVG